MLRLTKLTFLPLYALMSAICYVLQIQKDFCRTYKFSKLTHTQKGYEHLKFPAFIGADIEHYLLLEISFSRTFWSSLSICIIIKVCIYLFHRPYFDKNDTKKQEIYNSCSVAIIQLIKLQYCNHNNLTLFMEKWEICIALESW